MIGKIINVGGVAATLTAAAYIKKLHDYNDCGYCVDDAYNNNPNVSGGTWRRVPPVDSSDYQHDVFVPVRNPFPQEPSDYGMYSDDD